MDPEKLFNDLESSNLQEYEESRQTITELLIYTKDPWLVHGMMDYYLKTNSTRVLEVLVKVQQPHDNYVFDRLSEWMRNQNRLAALSLFGFIVRKHPTWLHKVAKHKLMKDILKLLQNEKDIVPLMSALLCIITLLPIIPSSFNLFVELFDVFGHLASWNYQNPNRLKQYQLIHLHLGLHMLFHRLYGMYPWNFISFLKDFCNKEKGAIYHHTIKPLLETVRIHPFLITGSKESEANISRWRDMQPHDVVLACAQLSLAYHQDFCTENLISSTIQYQQSTISTNILPVESLRNPSFQPFQPIQPSISSPFHTLLQRENITDLTRFSEQIWSPQLEILATPPPAGTTIPHTPTPHYVMPSISTSTDHVNMTTNSLLNVSGSSPPEAAVEATPETTPLKDISTKRSILNNKPGAARTILPTSQPSSPMRKEQSPFNFPTMLEHSFSTTNANVPFSSNFKFITTATTNTTVTSLPSQPLGLNYSSQRLIKIINDRNSFNTTGSGNSGAVGEQKHNSNIFSKDLHNSTISTNSNNGGGKLLSMTNQSLDSPTFSTELDLEVTTLTSQQGICASSGAFGDSGAHHSDTLQDISNEYGECDETEESLCSLSGVNVPMNRLNKQPINRTKYKSGLFKKCRKDVRLTKSWPALYLGYYNNDDNFTSVDYELFPNNGKAQQNGIQFNNYGVKSGSGVGGDNDSSSPSGDDAISAATHFKKIQQKKDRKDGSVTLPHTNSMGNNRNVISKFTGAHNQVKEKQLQTNILNKPKVCKATQTIEQWPHTYETNLLELFNQEKKIRESIDTPEILQPQEILDNYFDLVVKSKQPNDQKTRDEEYKEQLQLLQLQLQYAEYRCEIHAERNRRLMGRSRDQRNLELENERLRDQVKHLEQENNKLIMESKETRKLFNEKEQLLMKEISLWKNKFQNELDENKQLRFNNEELQKKLNEEIKNSQSYKYEIDTLRGDIFDMKQDLENTKYQAELGLKYKEDLVKLETEFLIMGEVQVKCKERFNQLENLRARDEEFRQLKETYKIEINELRANLEEKIPQLESAKYRLTELHQQLVNKDILFTDQKRLLKSVKDEYEEKFKALNKKYEAQKSIILQMEQKMLELNKNRILNSALSPESEKIDIASSVDRTSPLSASLASSEGLSASLRSVPDLCNLQSIATATTNNSVTRNAATNTTTSNLTTSPQKLQNQMIINSPGMVLQQTTNPTTSLTGSISNDGSVSSVTVAKYSTISNSNSSSSSSASAAVAAAAATLQQPPQVIRNKNLPLSQQLQQHQILTTSPSTSYRFNDPLDPAAATIASVAAAAAANSNTSNIPVPGPSQHQRHQQYHLHQHHHQYSTHHK